MSFFDRFRKQRPQPTVANEDTSDARRLGKDVGAGIAEILGAFRETRVSRLKSGYLELFRTKQIPRIFDDPSVDPAVVLRIEYDVFSEQVDVLEPQLMDEASSLLTDWLSDELGVRDIVVAGIQKMVHDEMVDLKLQGFHIMVDEGGGAILERQQKASGSVFEA